LKNVAHFEKVSFDRFCEDWMSLSNGNTSHDAHVAYSGIALPTRATTGSAGHDICTPFEIQLGAGQNCKMPTGLRCAIDDGYVMLIVPRSSIGMKHNLIIKNTIGVIDSDYYSADNEGHIWLSFHNYGNKPVHINAFDRVAQAVFVPYGVADTEEVTAKRTSGIGSTGR